MNTIAKPTYLYDNKTSQIWQKNRCYVTIKNILQACHNRYQHNYDVTNFKSKYSYSKTVSMLMTRKQ